MEVTVYLNARCKEILELLMTAGAYMTIDEIARAKMISRRSIYYDLCKINEWLEYHEIPQIEVERGRGICLTPEQTQRIVQAGEQPDEAAGYVLSPGERVGTMICLIGSRADIIRIEDLMQYCQVSRNTIFNDLKVISTTLQKYDLQLVYENKKGYHIAGDAVCRRTVCLYFFYSLISLYTSGIVHFEKRDSVQEYMERLRAIENSLNTHFPEEMLLALSSLLPMMMSGEDVLDLRDVRLQDLINAREFTAVAEYFPELIESEQIYLALHLLGGRIQINLASRDAELYTAARSLVAEFEKTAGIHFENESEIERALFMHLKSSWYRLRYGIRMDGAPLLQDLIRANVDLLNHTRKACGYLENELALPISDSEIAYLALNFAGYMKQSVQPAEEMRILIVCCQGMTTGHILRWEISTLLPKARVVDVVAQQDVFNVKDICDVVVSTVPVKSDVPVEVVHPIMTDKERIALLRMGAGALGMLAAPVQAVNVQELMAIVQRYVPEPSRPALRKDLEAYLRRKARALDGPAAGGRGGLLRWLSREKICLYDGELDWRKALEQVARPLLSSGSVEPSYIKSIITMLESTGTYMFFVPWLVLAHARPDAGVNRLDVAMGIFRQPVRFSRYRHAKIVILLAPVDKESHLEILRDLMRIFAVQTRIDELQHKNTPYEVLESLEYYLNQEEEGEESRN